MIARGRRVGIVPPHVGGKTAQVAPGQGLVDRRLVDHHAATHVDQQGAGLQDRKLLMPHQPAGPGSEGQSQDYGIGRFQYGIEPVGAHEFVHGVHLPGNIAPDTDGLHPEGAAPCGNKCPDTPQTDDRGDLPGKLDAGRFRRQIDPVDAPHRPVVLRDSFSERQQQRHGVLGHRHGIDAAGVGERHSAFEKQRQIVAVVTGMGGRDQLQLARFDEDLAGKVPADDDFSLAAQADQFRRVRVIVALVRRMFGHQEFAAGRSQRADPLQLLRGLLPTQQDRCHPVPTTQALRRPLESPLQSRSFPHPKRETAPRPRSRAIRPRVPGAASS